MTHHIGSKGLPVIKIVHARFQHHCIVYGVLELDRTHRIQDKYTFLSVLNLDSISMKPRVTAYSRRYSHIPRINAHSVYDWGQTLHTGIQSAGACWCWSQTEHGIPESLLILVIAGYDQCTYKTRVFVLESYSRW